MTIYLLHAKNNNIFFMEKKITDNSGLAEVEGAIQLQKGNVIVHWGPGVKLGVLHDMFDRQCLLGALLQGHARSAVGSCGTEKLKFSYTIFNVKGKNRVAFKERSYYF